MEEISDLLRKVTEGQETIFDLLDESDEVVKTIEVRRRAVQPEQPVERAIERAKARNHVFHDAETFGHYLARESSESASIVLADTQERVITAVLDEGNERDRETVSLQAMEHPLFAPWSRLLNNPIGVVDFALFVMRHRRAVVEPNGRELAFTFSQIKMSKAVSVQSGVGNLAKGQRSINSVMVEVTVAGAAKEQPVDLPESITIDVPLFVGTSPQKIEIDLLVTTKGDAVVVYATASDVEEKRIAAFDEMVDQLREITGRLVGLGSVQHRNWELVR